MAGEVYRFKRVLHVREVERSITQTELAEHLQREETISRRVEDLQAAHDSALSDFCSSREEAVSPQQFWLERQSLDVMEKRLDSGKKELETCRHAIEETKEELVEKHRDVQLMARYVDKLKQRDYRKLLATEQSNLDDITSMRYLRARKDGTAS